ncbi:MAG: transglycosylase SLT domain-containing protein [Nocardioides sp.]|nr:transglycosylase SLT domain-containing protein [Nocardioides sp.]
MFFLGKSRSVLARTLSIATAAALGSVLLTPATAVAHPHDPDERKEVRYTVRTGDTATGIATRLHAWTAELVAANDLGSSATLRAGQVITVPVVLAALEPGEVPGRPGASGASGVRETKPTRSQPKRSQQTRPERTRTPARASREEVRRTIVRTADAFGVDRALALAVGWQESGWQQHVVSSADAIGAMQVLPGTGEWMESYVGRPLDLHRLADNVAAGVALLDLLTSLEPRRRAIAAYYQGLAGVREHGMYDDTKVYVRNVDALRERFASKIGR